MNWICPICSSANPKGERECYVCGSLRDEAEILAEERAAEEAAREAERLARLEAERIAEEERRRAEEAERLMREAERRARLEAERLARLEEERRRLAAEAAERERREAKDRKICNRSSLIFKIAFISSLSLFAIGAIGQMIILATRGGVGDVISNIFNLIGALFSGVLRIGSENLPAFFEEFYMSSYTMERILAFWGNVSRHLIEISGGIIPEIIHRATSALLEAKDTFLAIFSLMEAGFVAAFATLCSMAASAEKYISEVVERASLILRGFGERLGTGGRFAKEVYDFSVNKITDLQK